jgi:hypothetical protein
MGVRKWARSCLQCQRAKVHHHVATPLGMFATPDARFDLIHIDLVGSLPSSNGCVYLLICIDRFTRWPEAIPIADGSADTVAQGLIQTWVSRFGVPSTITTDRGGQFGSHLWKALTELLGTKHTRTTAHHPIYNGMVERFHRQLKSSLKASPHPERWADMLPLVLLGIHTTLKEDLKCTAADLVYGTGLRLPGEFFTPQATTNEDPANYVTQLRTTMQALRCTPTRQPWRSKSPSGHLSPVSHTRVHAAWCSHCSRHMTGRIVSWTGLIFFTSWTLMVALLLCPKASSRGFSQHPRHALLRHLLPPATWTTHVGRHVRWPQEFHGLAARWRESDVVSGLWTLYHIAITCTHCWSAIFMIPRVEFLVVSWEVHP